MGKKLPRPLRKTGKIADPNFGVSHNSRRTESGADTGKFLDGRAHRGKEIRVFMHLGPLNVREVTAQETIARDRPSPHRSRQVILPRP
jgi:hypothetical protein